MCGEPGKKDGKNRWSDCIMLQKTIKYFIYTFGECVMRKGGRD
jgi:hypothetical protein